MKLSTVSGGPLNSYAAEKLPVLVAE